MTHHGSVTDSTNLHRSHTWEYPDATTRTGATGLLPGDVGKLARQMNDNTLWMLTDDSPVTWNGIGGSSYSDEQARDAMASALVAGTGITITPNDPADTITIASTVSGYTDEQARDALAAALVAGSNVSITVNDPGDTITISAIDTDTNTTDPEVVRDTMASALIAGTGINITPNDPGDTITITATGTVIGTHSHTGADITDFAEVTDDRVGALIVAGTGITATYNDSANTLTIASTGTVGTHTHTGSDVTDFSEVADDRIANLLVAGTGIGLTYNDAANTLTVSVLRRYAVNFLIDGAGSAIPTGIKGDIVIETAGTIESWTVLADVSGSIQIDLWKDTYANYPPTISDTITASAKPIISSAIKAQSSTLTGWTTAVSAGDIIRVNVDSATTITRATLSLKIREG